MATTPIYTSPFTGTVVTPTDVSYLAFNLYQDTQLYWPSVVNPTQVAAPRIMDVTPSGSGLVINLPNAAEGAVGTDILIRNYGPATFYVADATGGASVPIISGRAVYFYLVDNTTVAGLWHNVGFGTGTSYTNAADLAGAGLTTILGQLAISQNVVQVNAVPFLGEFSRAATYVWTSGAVTFTLPPVSNLLPGWFIGFRNNGTGTMTLVAQAPSQINGSNFIPVNPGDSGYIMYDVTTGNYFTVGLANPTNITFTSGTYDVDSIPGNTFSLLNYAPIIQNYVALTGTRTTSLLTTFPQITQLYVVSNETGTSTYQLQFQVSGSLASPVVVQAGRVSLLYSDGTDLYVISEQATGIFFANNGSAAAPSYTFSTNATTGMYLAGVNQLGFTANGNNIMTMDNSNLLAPQIITDATFTAGLIAGGTF